jgi:hypothetical protein
VHANCARAAYLSLRGDHDQAIELYEQIVAELVPRVTIAWLPMRGHFAGALNRAGQHARAKALLTETFEHVRQADREVLMLCFEPRRQLALADAGLGEIALANAQLRALHDDYFALDNPLLLGLIHVALALVALASADRGACLSQLALTDDYYRKTRNPVLIARCKRLADAAARAGLRDAMRLSLEPDPTLPSRTMTSRTLTMGELAAAPDRGAFALRLVMEPLQAKAGYLYLLEDGKLRRAAASGGEAPPEALEHALAKQLEQLEDDVHTVLDPGADAGLTTRFSSIPVRHASRDHHVIVLAAQRDGRAIAVGGLILELDSTAGASPDVGMLQAVAEALYRTKLGETMG